MFSNFARCAQVEVATHLMVKNGSLFAFDFNNGTIAISEDGGKTWKWTARNELNLIPSDLIPMPVIVCVSDQPTECYRINDQIIVETSNDGGKSWKISWELPADRFSFMKRIDSDINLGPYDLLIFQWENRNYVLVAAGEEGILLRELPDGEWERIQVQNAIPTPYKSASLSNTFSTIWIELLIWFFISILVFMVACWIVWLTNSKTSEQNLDKAQWVFSPALSPVLGIFLTLFIQIIIGFIFFTIGQIIMFAGNFVNALLIVYGLCVVMALGILPATIYFILDKWRLTLIQNNYSPHVAQRLVWISYLAHIGVFVVGALVWLSWTFAIISTYSFALVSALICTGLTAMFFLKKIQDLSKQHDAMTAN